MRIYSAPVGAVVALVAAALASPALHAQEVGEIVVTARKKEERLKEVPLAITAFDTEAIEAAAITNLGDVAALTPGLSFFNAFGENLPVPVIRGVVPQDIFGINAAAIFVDGVYVSGREGLNFSQLDVERIEVVKGPQSALYGRNAFSGAINYITRKPSEAFEAKSEAEAGNEGKQRIMGSVSGPVLGDMPLYGRFSALYDEWDGSYDNTEPGGDDIGGYRYRSFQGSLRWVPADTLEVTGGVYVSNDEIDEAAVAALPTNCEDQLELTETRATNEPFPRLQNYCGEIPGLDALPDALDASQYPSMVTLPDSVTDDSMPKVAQATGEDRDLLRGNLNVNWDLDFGTLSFLTGYSDLEQNSVSDFGRSVGNAMPFIYCPNARTDAPVGCLPPLTLLRTPQGWYDRELGSTVEEWSQEVRFTSPAEERLRYTVGAYYFNVDQENFPGAPIGTQPLPDSILNIGVGPLAHPTTLAIGSYIFGPSLTPDGAIDPLGRVATEQKTQSWSVFGAVDFDLTDAWQLGAELRFTEEAQEAFAYNYQRCVNDAYYATGDSNLDPSVFPYNDAPADLCGDDFYDLRVVGPCVEGTADYAGTPDDPDDDLYDCAPGYDRGTQRFSSVTGRVSAKYKFESGWMAYGSIAWGEKPGGLTLVQATVITEDGTTQEETFANKFDPEKITAYEIGIKGFSADRRLGLDVAMFYNDWTDIVLRQLTDVSPATGRPFDQPTGLNVNAGDARVWGWEVVADLAITDNLTGRLTGAWTDSQLENARQDTYSLFPSFYTTDPTCTPEAIQAISDPDPDAEERLQNEKAGECQSMSGNLSGNTQMRQPEWTGSASLTYERPLAGDWNWFTRADANYQSKIYVGNDNQSWLPGHTYVNLRIGAESPRYSLEFWVRNLFEDDNPIAAFRDIYWTNDSDIQGQDANPRSNFDDFPPLRMSVTYPKLRTFGLVAKVRFGGEER
jgi:outer membrane receptor protein involved in Fe transport